MENKFKKLMIALAVFGLLSLVFNIIIDNPYSHKLARVFINEYANEHTHLIIDFKAIKLSVIPPKAELYGLYIATDTDPASPIVEGDHLTASLSMTSLIWGRFSIGTIEGNGFEIIWPPPWGFNGFSRESLENHAPTTDKIPIQWPLGVEIPVKRIKLTNTQIYFDHPLEDKTPHAPKWLNATLFGVNVDINITDSDSITADLDAPSVNFAMNSSSVLEDTNLKGHIELEGNEFIVTNLHLKGHRLDIVTSIRGEISSRPGSMPKLSMTGQGQGTGDLSVVGSVLDLGETRGRFLGDFDYKVLIDPNPSVDNENVTPFSLRANVAVEDGFFYGFQLFNSSGQLSVSLDGIEFENINIIIEDKSYGTAQGRVDFNDQIDYKFTGQPNNLRLVDLLGALGVSFNVFDTGIYSPDLSIVGKGSPFILNVKATADFGDFQIPALQQEAPAYTLSPTCRLNVDLEVTSTKLDFRNSKGNCFESKLTDQIKSGVATAPARSLYSSPLALKGLIHFNDKGMDLIADSKKFDLNLARYFSQLPMAGAGSIQTRIHGGYDGIRIATKAVLKESKISAFQFSGLDLETVFYDNKLTLFDSIAKTQSGQIVVDESSLEFNDSLDFKVDATLTNIEHKFFEKISKTYIPDYQASLKVNQLSADFQGPLLFPLAWRGKLQVDLEDGSLENQKLFSTISGNFSSTADNIYTKDLTYTIGTLAIRTKVDHNRAFEFSHEEAASSSDPWIKLGLHPDDETAIEFETLQPESKKNDHLAAIPVIGQALNNLDLRGQVQVKGKLRGRTNDIQGTIEGSVYNLNVFSSRIPPLKFRSFIKQDQIDIVLNHAGNAFEGRLSLELLEKNIPYEWFFTMNRMDLRSFFTRHFHKDPRNFGYISADWQMKGHLLDWWRSTGELAIRDIRAKYVQDTGSKTKALILRQEDPVKFIFSNENGWHFENDRDLFLSGQYLGIKVSTTQNNPPDKLGLKAVSIIDMSVVKEFSNQIDSTSGKIRVEAKIDGSVEEPKFEVEITDLKQNPYIAATWKPVQIGFADLRPPFSNIRFRALLRNQKFLIDYFTADKGIGGTVRANGSLDFSEFANESPRIDISLKEAKMIYPVIFIKNFESTISGNIAISGKKLPLHISGDIEIDKSRTTKEVDIRDELLEALRRRSFSNAMVFEKPIFTFDLNVLAKESINISNSNMQSTLSADLIVKGNNKIPEIGGQVEAPKGKFRYKNREFNITRGLVTFDDPVKPDPSLDILAVSDVKSWRVYLAVTGRASNYAVDFTIDPATRQDGTPISKVEILVLLSRGSLPDEGSAIGDAAASEVFNLFMGQFEEPVEKLLERSGQKVIRNLTFESYQTEDGDLLPLLSAPLNLGDEFDVVMRASKEFGEVSAEYSIDDNVNVSFSGEAQFEDQLQDDENVDLDADLNFRFSFE